MGTTWRNTTVKSRLTFGSISAMLFCALAPGALTLAGNAQMTGVQSSQPGAGAPSSSSTSASKAAMAGAGQGPVVLPRDFSEIRIAPGDLLSVNVYDTPELSDGYRVDPGGNVTLPLCGKVRVQGLTATEAARVLETTLRDGQVLVRPQVNVDVQQYAGQYVTVLGEVGSPGRVTVIAPTKLSEILAQVGGMTPMSGTRIKIRHGADDAAAETDVPYSRSESNQQTGSIVVRPGDTVLVPRAGIVYVLGAVFRPGGYLMQEDGKLNVAEALAMSGGTLLQAKTNGLRVIRRNPDGTVLDFSLSYDGIAKGSQTPLELQAQDIVYVPMSKVKAALSDATSIISTAISATIYTAR
jgi:polysaccharide export outer membrane protein